MRKLQVNSDGFNLTMEGPKGKEGLYLKGGHVEDSPLALTLFAQLGAMHLVAPYLPREIKTNFAISKPIQKLIGKMYRSEKHKPPRFNFSVAEVNFTVPRVYKNRAVVAYSAGKDSMWNLWWAKEKYGERNVSALHINGLNKSNASREKQYSLKQQKEIGFPLTVIDLATSSLNTGYDTMRSRDMFLVGLTVPQAISNLSSKIITEGFAEAKPGEPFSGQERNMVYFNGVLKEMGIPVEVIWRSKKEMSVIKDLYYNKPEWMPHMCNCFSPPNYGIAIRKAWKKNAPTLKLYDSQCGSCVKCRIINLARLFYDRDFINNTTEKDKRVFLGHTVQWVRNKKGVADMIEGSFMEHLYRACAIWGIDMPISVL